MTDRSPTPQTKPFAPRAHQSEHNHLAVGLLHTHRSIADKQGPAPGKSNAILPGSTVRTVASNKSVTDQIHTDQADVFDLQSHELCNIRPYARRRCVLLR